MLSNNRIACKCFFFHFDGFFIIFRFSLCVFFFNSLSVLFAPCRRLASYLLFLRATRYFSRIFTFLYLADERYLFVLCDRVIGRTLFRSKSISSCSKYRTKCLSQFWHQWRCYTLLQPTIWRVFARVQAPFNNCYTHYSM